MALEAGFPSGDGVTTHAAARRDLEGMVVRNAAGKMRAGVFYAHAGDLFNRRPDMRLDIPEFRAVQDKQGACFIAGVGATTTPAFDAAPAANKRIDLLYLTQELASLDGTTETIFGIVKGTASPTPTVPALPAAVSDAIPWATVEIPAGATSMQSGGVIITPVYPYTAMAGGTVVVRNAVELTAWTPADSAKAFNLADTVDYVRRGGSWKPAGGGLIAAGTITAQSTIVIDGLTGYEHYEVLLDLPTSSTPNDVNLQLRAGGVVDASAQYDREFLYGAVNAAGAVQQLAANWWGLGAASRSDKSFRLNIIGLNRPTRTAMHWSSFVSNNYLDMQMAHVGGKHRAATAFDGIQLSVTAGTVNGYYSVRGS